MKGIVLAGGAGTRMYPMTLAMSKQLLPVYDKPMIYYPLSILMMAGIRDILIISTPRDLPDFFRLLNDGHRFGVRFTYKEQPRPEGLAQAFILGEEFLNGDSACLILGDNIFYGADLMESINYAKDSANGFDVANIFGYRVKDPERYGVLEWQNVAPMNAKVISIEEKPEHPKSNYAIPGLYFYPNDVCEKAKKLKPSARNELEITDLNHLYLEEKRLCATILSRGTAWLDTGTHESLQQASDYVAAVQQRSGVIIACLEEIAYNKGWISKDNLLASIKDMGKSPYADYLRSIYDEVPF